MKKSVYQCAQHNVQPTCTSKISGGINPFAGLLSLSYHHHAADTLHCQDGRVKLLAMFMPDLHREIMLTRAGSYLTLPFYQICFLVRFLCLFCRKVAKRVGLLISGATGTSPSVRFTKCLSSMRYT